MYFGAVLIVFYFVLHIKCIANITWTSTSSSFIKYTLEKTEGAIQNKHLRDTHNIGLMVFALWCFNANVSNISAISLRSVLVVEKPDYPKRTTDHGQATGKLCQLRLKVECTLFAI